MVNSADEPPLSSRLHSWAKSKEFTSSLFSSSTKNDPISSPTDSVHPVSQNAGHQSAQRAEPLTSPKNAIHHPDNEDEKPSPLDTEGDGEKSAAIDPGPSSRLAIHKRFVRDVNRIVRSSWVNWLLLVVPVALIIGAIQDWGGQDIVSPAVIFALNAVAIIPLASLLAFATESVAMRLGDTIGALLNVTFGNAVEIIIFIIALVEGQVRIVQAAALGSILSNLLLILGMCFIFGGLRFREQLYNASVSQMSSCLLSLSVISLILPTAFHAAFQDTNEADDYVLPVSRGTAVILLIVYILYLLFQLKSHSFIFQSTPQHVIDEESHPGIMAGILNSSSSSDDSSSSSDSDSSYNTARRIKRALRRKRRKSISSRDNTSFRSFTRSSTLVTGQSESLPHVDEPNCSGDEADSETRRRRRSSGHPAVHDFETQATNEKGRRHRKTKRSKRASARGDLMEKDETEAPKIVTPKVEVNPVEAQPEASTRPPFHLRNLSEAIKPAFSSDVFPHHQASGRSLLTPALRPVESRSPEPRNRRPTSMPNIGRRARAVSRGRSPALLVPLDAIVDIQAEDVVDPEEHLSKTSSIILLLCTTGLVALCAEFLVGSLDYMIASSGLSQAFIGLIILPIVGNAAEHVTAVTVAYKNKMDLAINIALGSSIQIALFITPLMVMLGWALGKEMSLYFSLFETVSLFASAFIVNYLMIDGRSNYMEGILLIAVYVIIGIAAFYYPPSPENVLG